MTNSLPPDYWYYQDADAEAPGWKTWAVGHKPLLLGAALFLSLLLAAFTFWPSQVPPHSSTTHEQPQETTKPLGGECLAPTTTDLPTGLQVVNFGGVRLVTVDCAEGPKRFTQVLVAGSWQSKSATPVGVALER